MTAEAIDLVDRMLRFDPVERITARDALQHPYFGDTQAAHLERDELRAMADRTDAREPKQDPYTGE